MKSPGAHRRPIRPRATQPFLAAAYGSGGGIVNVLLGLALLVLAALPARAEPARHRLVVIGDSLVAGFGLPLEQAFPARLEAALRARGHSVAVLNAGVSGDTSAGGRARLEWALGDRPTAAILELGGNDGLRGIDPEVTFANLDAIIAALRARGIAVLLAGMRAPPNLGAAYGAAFEGIYPRLAAKHGVPLDPFFLEGAIEDPALMMRDGIHPNPAGVEAIVRRILPRVEALLR